MKKIFIYSLIIFFIFTPIVYAIQGEIIGINEKENTILLKKENNSWFDKLKRFFGLDKAPFFEVYEVLINNPSVSQIDRNKLFNLFKEKTTLENLKPGDNIEIKDESSLHILKKESPEEIVCSKKYEPVCGKNNAVYLNECVALKNKAEIACYKECPCSGSKDEESFPVQIFDQVNFGLKTEKEDYFLLTSHQEYFQYIKDIIDPRLEKDYLTNNKVTLDENQNLKEYIEGSFKIDFSKNNILVIQPGTSYSHMSDILIHSIQKVDKTLFINYSVTMSKQCTSEDKEYYPAILIVVPKDHDIKYSKKINIIDCPFKLNYTCSKDSDCIKVGQNNNVCISKKTYDLDMFAEIENKEEYINKLLGENSNIFKDFAHSLLKYETMPCSCVNSKCEFVRYENVYEEENLCVLTSDCDNLEISNCPANHFCFYSCIKGKCEVIIEPISDKSLNQMSDIEIEQFKKEIEKQENSNYHPGKCFTDKDCIGYTSDSPKPPCPETASFCGYVCLDNQCIYQVVANEAKKESTTTNTTVTTKKEAVKEIFHPPYNPLCVDVKHKVDCLQDLDCERMFNKQNRQSNSICK
ncbi:MAG: Kazal-type serine protease inhibitor [Candidatus Pacebacteria bacterium]|nr:Kazal-type serine protease inhibitor [Candidatus Paceibacterota bacterium]